MLATIHGTTLPLGKKIAWSRPPKRTVPGRACVSTPIIIRTRSRTVFRPHCCWLEIGQAVGPVGWSIDSHFRHGIEFARSPHSRRVQTVISGRSPHRWRVGELPRVFFALL